jgi:GntR family transcriptional regulator, transcriptional repressor for pyruvate dehydrogenase complex
MSAGIADLVMPNQDLTVKLIARIKGLISTGVLVPCCKFPPERELATRFGVSRPSIRQALKVLEIMGVISQRVGDGTYLNENASEILNEPMEFLILMDGISIHELVELRSILEPELAALAAERATAQDLRGLDRSIKEMEDSRHNLAKSIEADLSFHRGIFQAAGNRACSRILAFIHRSVWQSLTITSQLVEAQRPLAGHKAIYNAIYQRDAEEARRQMTEHMRRARQLLIKASQSAVDLSMAEGISKIKDRAWHGMSVKRLVATTRKRPRRSNNSHALASLSQD